VPEVTPVFAIDRVPTDVIVPPASPVPAVTAVTVPPPPPPPEELITP
jgi:hypothetical protein